jgi:hypothetical protein
MLLSISLLLLLQGLPLWVVRHWSIQWQPATIRHLLRRQMMDIITQTHQRVRLL